MPTKYENGYNMKLRLYNTQTRKKELFKPLKKGVVGFYACGPTVYDYVHLGNLRTYIFQDILKATLGYAGFRVRHIMNITDIDDKTIAGAQHAHLPLAIFTRRYEKQFKEDLKKLHIAYPATFTRATEHIPQMIALIKKLLKNGMAYKADGSVYFNISRFHSYGRLSRLSSRTLKAGTRIDTDEYAKQSVQDFVLWKAKKDEDPSWPAPFGEGRPGWHIECSAMAGAHLAQPLDIHTGGVDLIFPHHENEIAQSEAASGKPFVRYWLHGEHLLINGQKMAKSLGNAYALPAIEKRGFLPLDFRYLVLTAHYRTKLNFTWQSLESAASARKELSGFIQKLASQKKETAAQKIKGADPYAPEEKKFFAAMADDLGTPRALAAMWQFIRSYRAAKIKHPAAAYALLLRFDTVLGLGLNAIKIVVIPAAIQRLAAKREKARTNKFWLEADRLRIKLEQKGWHVDDTADGPVLRKK